VRVPIKDNQSVYNAVHSLKQNKEEAEKEQSLHCLRLWFKELTRSFKDLEN
jgi:hypothetical protein